MAYPLVMTNIANWKITIEIKDFSGFVPLKIVIFNSYV